MSFDQTRYPNDLADMTTWVAGLAAAGFTTDSSTTMPYLFRWDLERRGRDS